MRRRLSELAPVAGCTKCATRFGRHYLQSDLMAITTRASLPHFRQVSVKYPFRAIPERFLVTSTRRRGGSRTGAYDEHLAGAGHRRTND